MRQGLLASGRSFLFAAEYFVGSDESDDCRADRAELLGVELQSDKRGDGSDSSPSGFLLQAFEDDIYNLHSLVIFFHI